MCDVFVSHSTFDDNIVNQINLRLVASNISTWIDHNDLPLGSVFDREIDAALKKCSAALLVLSKSSVQSDECLSECRRIIALKKPLYIVQIDAIPLEKIPYRLDTLQRIDLTKQFDVGLDNLIRALLNENFQSTIWFNDVNSSVPQNSDHVRLISELHSSSPTLTVAVFSPDGNMIALGQSDNSIALRTVPELKLITTLLGHKSKVSSLSWSSDGRFLASGDCDGTIIIWNTSTNRIKTRLTIPAPDLHDQITSLFTFSRKVKSLVFSPNSEVLAVTTDKIYLWSVLSNSELHSLRITPFIFFGRNEVLAMSFHANSKCLYALLEHRSYFRAREMPGETRYKLEFIKVDVGTGQPSLQRQVDKIIVKDGWERSFDGYAADFSSDNKLFAYTSYSGIHVRQINDQELVQSLDRRNKLVDSIVYSVDGKYLGAGGRREVTLVWNLETENLIIEQEGLTDSVNVLLFSPHDKVLASYSENKLEIWSLPD